MESKLVISLDFELFWGMQDCSTLDDYQNNVLGGRKAIPTLLKLFEKYNIHATWATVGFMFADNYEELQNYFPNDDLKPHYVNKDLSTYRCFSSIGKNEEEAPCFYASSLIKLISKTNGQEIGCHTFSHYYCREMGQTIEEFDTDINAAINLAKEKGYELKSIVLPRNQCEDEYIDVLKKYGFISYRDEENDWIHHLKNKKLLRILRLLDVYFPLTGQGGYNPTLKNGIVKLQGSRMYKPYFKVLSFMENVKIRRIKKQMLHAAKNGLVFHLWWHPHNIGVKTDFHLKQLEEILMYYKQLNEKYGMESLNMRELSEEYLGG